MSESYETQESRPTLAEIISLATELSQSHEVFLFSGIEPESYVKMKKTDEFYPGYSTPTDEIIQRLESEGMKVVLGDHPDTEFFILPAGSNDIVNDSLLPKDFQINDSMNEKIKKLILLAKRYWTRPA